MRAYVEEHFDTLVDQELAKYGALAGLVAGANVREVLLKQKAMLPEGFRLLQPEALRGVDPAIDAFLSQHPEFLELIARARADFVAGRTVSLSEMKRRRAAEAVAEQAHSADGAQVAPPDTPTLEGPSHRLRKHGKT